MYTDVQDKILRFPDAKMKTGIACSTIYSLMAKGQFPKAIPLTSRSVDWLESEINQWVADGLETHRRMNSANDSR